MSGLDTYYAVFYNTTKYNFQDQRILIWSMKNTGQKTNKVSIGRWARRKNLAVE